MRTPWCTLTRASLPGTRAAVRSRFWPMVSPSNATGLAPCTYEGSLATSIAASLPQGMRAPAPFCDDTLQNPTWRAFAAALRVVGNLLDAGAVHPRHSARGPPAGLDGEQPDRLLTRGHRRSPGLQVRMVAQG